MIVDLHAHYVPKSYNDILMRLGGRSLPEAARLINDSYAELASLYPGRLAAAVSLPMPNIDASLREMERGVDQLGMLGVSMTCSCFDR